MMEGFAKIAIWNKKGGFENEQEMVGGSRQKYFMKKMEVEVIVVIY